MSFKLLKKKCEKHMLRTKNMSFLEMRSFTLPFFIFIFLKKKLTTHHLKTILMKEI
jgi:predicted ribonuclease YlaK